MELRNYPKEFVERTIKLIECLSTPAKQHGLDATFLLNCLLGLIVAAWENFDKVNKSNRIFFRTQIKELQDKKIIPQKVAHFTFDRNNNETKSRLKNICGTSLYNLSDGQLAIMQEVDIKWDHTGELELQEFVKKIRNGVSHQNIMPMNQDRVWKGIRIWNLDQGVKDFEVEFKISELKKFALFLANKYVELS